ncbi:MAG: hypothetical protein MK207_10470 [Saprospiraceae bacterium]|nr:hypothetical protein [Saprospiraceae bacterium]
MDLEKIYKERLVQNLNDQQQKIRITSTIGNLRVILFLLMVFLIIKFCGSNFETMYYWWSFLAVVPVFALLVKVHQKHIEEKEIIDQLVQINEKELLAIETNQAQFDDGKEYVDPHHNYSADLDLFGKNSLFAFVNRTATSIGKKALADLFNKNLTGVKAIQEQQAAIKVLSPNINFRQNFMANGLITEDTIDDIIYLQQWAEAPFAFVNSNFWKIIRIVLPLISVYALIYFVLYLDYAPLLLMAFINFALLGVKGKYVGKEHTEIGKRQDILKMYISLLDLSSAQNFKEAVILNEIKSTGAEAQVAFEKLSSIVRFFDQRLNIFVGLGLNMIILYDVHCLFALEGWKKKNKQFLSDWLNSVARLDSLISLATFKYNNPEFTFPEFEKSEKLFIEAKALGHPLINSSLRICSDTKLGGRHKVFVVTGSNMAGKSTFLRCVAINLLLAKCGAPVCADSFKCSLMNIMTSMRVQDSISQNISYFQAELLRLQHIINTLKDGTPTFIILDEILKGTNSEDKLLGSQLLVRHFLNFNCLALIATHDLELGNMQNELPEEIQNLCFESIIENDELSFDYKLNRGIAKNKNATFLMRKMDIVPNL